MCGRLACGLQPDDICTSCCYKEKGQNSFTKPEWKAFHNQGKVFKPSFNICPKDLAPILISGSYFNATSRYVVPMVFGLIPPWSETNNTEKKYSTINCRIETIESSRLYGPLLKKGQRCVVVCMGFFEWNHNKGGKPYFFHAKQPNSVSVDDPNTWNIEFTSENGCKGLNILKMAGLFNVKKDSPNENNETFSFTIITQKANSDVSWLHQRMPTLIDTEEQLNIWLNSEEYDSTIALKLLMPQKLFYYPISTTVNFINNKDILCIKKMKILKTLLRVKPTLINGWKIQKGKILTAEVIIIHKKIKKEN